VKEEIGESKQEGEGEFLLVGWLSFSFLFGFYRVKEKGVGSV